LGTKLGNFRRKKLNKVVNALIKKEAIYDYQIAPVQRGKK